MNLLEHVGQSIRERGLFKERERIVVAVSGGLDSTLLLHLLHELAVKCGWKLAVAHLNHRLRGRSSDADERFVRKLAAKLDVPCFVEHAEVRASARRQKLSLEMAARQLRHEFLARSARRFKARTVALAHHADDQVELFFLRLLRGSGGEGLGGMKWSSPSPVRPRIRLVRPLLGIPREALRQYTAEHKLKFREDASNASFDFLRNRIRHRLLPLLRREYQPGVAQTVLRLMEIVGAEAAFTNDIAQVWLQGKRSLHLSSFETLPIAIQRAVVRRQLLEQGTVPDFELVAKLIDAANRHVAVGRNVAAWRNGHGHVRAAEQAPLRFKGRCRIVELKGRGGKADFAGCRFAWRIVRRRGAALPAQMQGREWFDADTVGSVITLRHWRPGDRFQPIGLRQPAKLQNLLTNARIPRERRRSLVVAEAADGRCFWVEELRIGEAFKLTGRTNRRLQWRWQSL